MPCSVPRSDQDGWRSLPTDELLASKPPITPPHTPYPPPLTPLRLPAKVCTNKQMLEKGLGQCWGKNPNNVFRFSERFLLSEHLEKPITINKTRSSG